MSDELNESVGCAQCGLNGVVQAAPVLLADQQSVDHQTDVVVYTAVELGRIGQIVDLPVHHHPHEPLATCALEEILEFPLPAADQGCNDLDLSSFGPSQDDIRHLRGTLTLDGGTVVGTVWHAYSSPEEPQVVVDLSHRPDRRAGVGPRRSRLDGDGRGETLDRVDVGFFHEPQELAGIGREGLHIAALSLRVDRIECEGGLAGPRQAGDDRHGVARDLDINIPKVVDSGSANDQRGI